MLSKVRKVGVNTFYFGLGNILNKSLGLILIPFYARHLAIEEYGILAILELVILTLLTILHLGITSGHERFFHEEHHHHKYGTFLFSNVTGLFLMSFIALSLLVTIREPISHLFWGSVNYRYQVLLILIITFIEINNIIPFQVLQYEGKVVNYIITNLVRLAISVAFTIYFVVTLQMGITGVLYGRLVGSLSTMLYQYITVILPRIVWRFDRSSVVKTIRFGFPVTISSVGYIIFASSDRYLLNWLAGEKQTGMYGFGYKIANIVMLLVQSVGIGYIPLMYQQEKEADNKRFYRKMLTYYIFSMTYIVLGFLFFYRIILWPLVQNKMYWHGIVVVPVLSLTFLIAGMNYFVNIGITLKNKTRYLILPTFVAAALNILLNLFLIPWIGFMGAAYAALISQVVNTLIIVIISNRLVHFGFEWGKICIIFITGILIYFAGTYIEFPSRILLAVSRITLIALFPFILYKLNIFEPIEIQRAREGFAKARLRMRHLLGR